MLHLVQTVDLSCTDTNAICKRTETIFYMTHIIWEFNRVRPKWFLSLWYVRRILCTYLESRLPLYPNGPKRASIWASSPRSTIRCVQNDFWGNGTFGTNVHLSCTEIETISKKDRNEILYNPRHLGVPSGASKSVSEAMVRLVQTVDLQCTDTNTISKWT
jgi:hypothetical protein